MQFGKAEKVEDPVVEMLAWLFVKPAEDILREVEVADLRSMFLAEDPRPERVSNNE